MMHILVLVALVAAMLPCGHAMHHDHHEDAAELCGIEAEPCCCHSCEHHSCAEEVEIQLDLAPVVATIEPFSPALLFVLPEIKPVLKQNLPPTGGILASLQTVQLLI